MREIETDGERHDEEEMREMDRLREGQTEREMIERVVQSEMMERQLERDMMRKR